MAVIGCCWDSKTALKIEIELTVHELRDLLIYINNKIT